MQPDPKETLREHQPAHARPRPVTRPQPIPPSSRISLVDDTPACPYFPPCCWMVRRGGRSHLSRPLRFIRGQGLGIPHKSGSVCHIGKPIPPSSRISLVAETPACPYFPP